MHENIGIKCGSLIRCKILVWTSEAATGDNLEKKLLKFSQNSQENTCVGVSFLIKLQPFQLY